MRIFGFEIQIKRYKRKPKTWKKAIKPKLNLDLDLIHQLKKEGVSNREIARRLGVSEGTIRNRLKELDKENQLG